MLLINLSISKMIVSVCHTCFKKEEKNWIWKISKYSNGMNISNSSIYKDTPVPEEYTDP